jgi:hypothetical protein
MVVVVIPGGVMNANAALLAMQMLPLFSTATAKATVCGLRGTWRSMLVGTV